ncbi:MAG: hypothetical protein FK733_00490 [Asgard group archaeon]|nr:hypothetical protein [Asgard group archaeon]
MKNHRVLKTSSFMILVLIFVSIFTITSSYTRNFVVNNDTEVLLDEETDSYYIGNLSITVTEGPGINATVNSETQEILLDETYVFIIDNTTQIHFEITASDYVEGYFVLDLNIDLNAGDGNPLTIVVGILAAFLVILTFVSYLVRSNRLKTKTDEEDEELMDPEVARRRKEAAGAEKKFWGIDEK